MGLFEAWATFIILIVVIIGITWYCRLPDSILYFIANRGKQLKAKHPKKQFIGLFAAFIGVLLIIDGINIQDYILLIPGLFSLAIGVIIMKWARTGF